MNQNVGPIKGFSNPIRLPESEWRPIDDRFLVQRLKAEERTPSKLIIIPENAQEKANKGIILAVGEWALMDESTGLKRKGEIPVVGDVIMFGKYSGSEFDVIIDGKTEELLIIRLNDVIAIRKTNIWDETRI